MTIVSEKLCDHMAVAVTGIDLNRPADPATQAELREALNRNLVLCIRGQKLAPPAFRDAMARFGTPMRRLQLASTEECAEVNIISSEDRDVLGDGKKLVNGASWHTDDSFMREPCSLTMLYGVVVPSRGGDTQFVNMQAAYEALSPEMKARIDGLQVIHKYQSSRQTNKVSKRPESEMKAMPEATHPLVRTHPETGRKALYTSVAHTAHIKGWTEKESLPLLQFLWDHQVKPEFTCRFRWQVGSLAFWDNRCAMHNPINDYHGFRRIMHRVTLEGDKPK